MSTVGAQSIVPSNDVRGRTAALDGAFAEGVDLGPRGAQIRVLGESLEAMIQELQLELGGLCTRLQINHMELNLDQLSRLVKAARTYGTGEAV